MLLKILGLFDLISVLIMLASDVLPVKTVLFAAAYLIVKGLLFVLTDDFVGYIDASIGLYLVLVSLGWSFGLLTVVSAVFLAQKGLLSLA